MNPQTIKVVSLIFIVWFFFIVPTFADNATATTTNSLKDIQEWLKNFIALCSRWWVVLAILAGKLMTNDFVYGAFLHMDVYLWKIWNIMKNFANFALLALVLGSIIKSLTGKEALDVKKILTNTLLAGILIQASWFLMGAIVDISTVATASISSFPMTFLNNDVNLKNEINKKISEFKTQRISVNLDSTGHAITMIPMTGTDTASSSDSLRKNIMPSYNSVSWPFIFLGMGVFHFQNYLGTEQTTDAPTLTLSFALRAFWLLFFTVGLLLLFIANIIRIGLLRIFIIWSPFLILLQLFKPKTWSGGIFKLFSLSNLLATVFKPLIFVIGISLMLIVVVSMQKWMMTSWAGRENNLNGVSLSQSWTSISTLAIDGVTNISVDQTDILWPNVLEWGKNFFSSTLILLLTIFLMRWFIKLSLTTGWWTIADIMKTLTKKAEEMAKTMPILPFKWWAASLGALQSFSGQQKKKLAEWFGMNTSGQFTAANSRFQRFMETKMGMDASWNDDDYQSLGLVTKDPSFMEKSREIGHQRNEWLRLADSTWQWYLTTWLNTTNGITAMQNTWAKLFKGIDKDFETTFKTANRTYWQALHELMGGDGVLVPGWAKSTELTYEKLMSNVYRSPK